jgi:hypothetical protein
LMVGRGALVAGRRGSAIRFRNPVKGRGRHRQTAHEKKSRNILGPCDHGYYRFF